MQVPAGFPQGVPSRFVLVQRVAGCEGIGAYDTMPGMSSRGRPPKLVGQEEEVISLYLGGATIVDLQEHFGCSDSPILRILDAAGIERRRGRPPGRGSAPREPREPRPARVPAYDPVGRPPVEAAESPKERADGRAVPQVRVPSVGARASRQVTDEVLRRDGYRCRLCGSGTRLTVEYAIPPEKGGNSRNPGDLRTVCASCASKPVEEAFNGAKTGFLKRILGR